MPSKIVQIPGPYLAILLILSSHSAGHLHTQLHERLSLNERIAFIEVRQSVPKRLPVLVPGAEIHTVPDLGIAYTDGRGVTTLYAEEGFFENQDLRCLRISAFHPEEELQGEILITSSAPLSYIEDVITISLGEYKHLVVHQGKIIQGTDGGRVARSRGACSG